MMGQFYLYHLVDPRDGKPFYVGKGKGRRIHDHEWEAARGVYSRKCSRIREIKTLGLKIGKVVVCSFANEADAYQAEEIEIASIGLENLTNVLPGGSGGYLVAPKRRPYNEKSLKILGPKLAEKLLMILNGNRIIACGYDITIPIIQIARSLVEDCGWDAFAKAMGIDGSVPCPS